MSKHAIPICLEFATPGGLEHLSTDPMRWGPYGAPQATRVAQRVPGTDVWLPCLASDDCAYLDADESDHAMTKTQAVAWVRWGRLPIEVEAHDRRMLALDGG